MSWCLMDSDPCTRQHNRAYGNEVRAAEGAGEGFPSRGWFSTDNICRTFSSFDWPVASSSALAADASKTLKDGAL
jgi:hypothetical protein